MQHVKVQRMLIMALAPVSLLNRGLHRPKVALNSLLLLVTIQIRQGKKGLRGIHQINLARKEDPIENGIKKVKIQQLHRRRTNLDQTHKFRAEFTIRSVHGLRFLGKGPVLRHIDAMYANLDDQVLTLVLLRVVEETKIAHLRGIALK